MAEGGKLIPEGDPEVSEAIDFCRFYAQTAETFFGLAGLHATGKGVAVVVSPWNFPLAIPCGGIAASLAAGNTVVFKPASDTALVGYRLCECFWRAGVPKSALQYVTSYGEETAQELVTNPTVKAVVFTGGTSTAAHLLKVNPAMPLFAETGGKNATIVTAMSDRDLAVKNVVQSAFGHGGQKCSATSLLLLEDEVYHDKGFRDVLCDAVESMRIGSAWDLATKMGPLILPPSGALEQGLKELEPGESWAVMPRLGVDGNPHLVSPGVKWNVQPESATHMTEFFGPLLGVMCIRTLSEGIDIVNRTGYGLTSGLESLDDREQEVWRGGIRAGNLYINRSTTGAIVLRQPFGGMGKSNVGPGIKAGGPNYVAQLMEFETKEADERAMTTVRPRNPQLADLLDWFPSQELAHALASYDHWARDEFLAEHDHFRLLGEDNVRRYLPVEVVRVRLAPGDTPWEVLARVAAARSVGCRVVVSWSPELPQELERLVAQLDDETESWAASIEFVEERDDELAHHIAAQHAGRLRYAHPGRVPEGVRQAAAEALDYVADSPVSPHGRVELLWYVREQSVSYRYHRYGNLGFRAEEARQEPA
jgi:RHH-type proline utilization regulon transcriptional repressor/proline dehydrogenase/delta 1-pyrroline-5-carboxylate dehydrogenase